MSELRRPLLKTDLPGPKTAKIMARSDRYLSPSYTIDFPLVAADGKGCWITDPDGNEFLDVCAGIAVTSTGHCHPEVVAAIQEQAARLVHMSGTDFYYPVQAQLSHKLATLGAVKGDDHRVYFGNSGAEAVEAAIKLARWKTGRSGLISFFNAFHGRTLGALSLTASKVIQKKGFGPLIPGVHNAYYPDPLRHGDEATAKAMASLHTMFERVIAPSEVAAIFCEPLQGEGGYIVPPTRFLQELRALCDEHGIMLVFDEVQAGMGRTGRMFAWQHSGVKPDILCLAKGIASGMPLGAIVARAEVMSWPPGSHASTFGGNPVSCAAALKTIELLEGGLIENSEARGVQLRELLQSSVSGHPRVAEIRGHGLMTAVELVTDRTSLKRDKQLRNDLVGRCFSKGLLILGCGQNSIRFSPALTISADEITVATEIFAEALYELAPA